MKVTSALMLLPAVASAAHFRKDQYDSGEVHQRIMDLKNASHAFELPYSELS
ncbi:hypothetical protein VDGD_20839 [Verticillium dahliae]|nr:hypothetical protein VDGD_20839 [Verticillium dahliae]